MELNKIIYIVNIMEKDSFNYTISSDDRTNITADQIYYDVNFGGLNSQYDDYKIEVVNCILSGDVDHDIGYLILTCEGLHENGVFCRTLLNANECVICTIPINVDTLMSNGGVSFIANNLRMPKHVRFKLLNPDFSPVTNGSDINTLSETKWLLTLRLTPIID
jgi:hypothetical protein